jgi:hypothetical protein
VSRAVASKMISNGNVVVDGSWILSIFVTDMKKQAQLRVHGDLHIGGLMLRLVEHVGEYLWSVDITNYTYSFKKSPF